MKRSVFALLTLSLFFSSCLPGATPGDAASTSEDRSPTLASKPTALPSPPQDQSPTPLAKNDIDDAITPTVTPIPTNTPIPTPTATPTEIFDQAKLGTSETDLTYCTIDGVSLKMDVYYPTYGEKPWPVVIYVHGGRWTAGDKAFAAGLRYFDPLLHEQIMVVSVNYRLAPEYIFPASLEDIKCAVRHLRSNAAYYNLNPLKIGALGTSAGGHLTSMLGLAGQDAGFDSAGGYQETSSRVQAVASLYGPSDFSISCKNDLVSLIFGASSCKDTGTLLQASPLSYVGPNAPPFLLMHGNKDTVVPFKHSRVLYRALVEAHAPFVTLVEVENAGHGFSSVSGKISPTKAEIAKILIDFFVHYLK